MPVSRTARLANVSRHRRSLQKWICALIDMAFGWRILDPRYSMKERTAQMAQPSAEFAIHVETFCLTCSYSGRPLGMTITPPNRRAHAGGRSDRSKRVPPRHRLLLISRT